MYILVCPCIINPSLRANGITSAEDVRIFSRCLKRCESFGIETVPLPCPETEYLGLGREPTNFSESLNNAEFSEILDEREKDVREIIRGRGLPLFILGVDSSPSCGVDMTYYSDIKIPGRGAFLSRFPDIPAIDVKEFAEYRIYLAAPLFSQAEQEFNLKVAKILRDNYCEVFLPQEHGDDGEERADERMRIIFERNLSALEESDIVVAVIDGADADSGTAWEMGYAYAKGKKVISLRTDFRTVGDCELVNLMLEESSAVVSHPEDILRIIMPALNLNG
ncbi:nucleoside 2-deoxyribosyltransferase [Methanoplanus endosymbiosus]|uniref:Nucleoside 2-deoxyribosyltransferase n=1 Tax=Methanoplanus endosymbiosus TaxID=33865 RepID=A0A9E7PM56_9EURY|nr:nucleoside 2-deoxyribosyltransferase [Methanoplanus endosymbiosus]UUX91176.1 nucleoside 2-deoxyribosyltransferase [Methanoplanus endosymbiosus]